MVHSFVFIIRLYCIRYMFATLEYVEAKFHEFNRLMFGGVLKPLPIRLSSTRTTLGQLRYYKKRSVFGGNECYDFSLHITRKVQMDQDLLDDTIIHEMIHYYILSNQLTDTSSHGKIFRKMMEDINARFGRNVSISHKRTEEDYNRDIDIRKHLVCVSNFHDGRVGISVVAESRIFRLWDEIPQFGGIKECKWYFTTNPYFNRFRRCITAKIYLVTDTEELEDNLLDALPLVREGSLIKLKQE